MARVRPFASAVLVLAIVCLSTARTDADAYDDDMAAADKKLVADLKSTLKWASGKRINAFRHRTCELILLVAPDDRRARSVLGYRRKGKGAKATWVRKDDYKTPVDFGKNALVEADERLKAVLASYRDVALAAMAAHLKEGTARHDKVLDRLCALMPHDGAVRAKRGDVETPAGWVMPDTKKAMAWREAVRTRLINHRRGLYSRVKPHPAGQKIGRNAAWTTGPRSLLGSVDTIKAKQVLVNVEVADGLCDHLFGKVKTQRKPALIRMYDHVYKASAFLRENPHIRGSQKYLDRLVGQWLSDGSYLVYRGDVEAMRRSVVRQLLDVGIAERFGRNSRGWITEGLGQRLCFYVENDHGPAFVTLRSTERHRTAGDEDTLPESAAAWNRTAADILERDGPLRLSNVLTRRLNAMKAGDILVAYGLAAYLLEVRGDAFFAFVEATIKRHDVDTIVQETLGMKDVATLARHLQRWLREN